MRHHHQPQLACRGQSAFYWLSNVASYHHMWMSQPGWLRPHLANLWYVGAPALDGLLHKGGRLALVRLLRDPPHRGAAALQRRRGRPRRHLRLVLCEAQGQAGGLINRWRGLQGGRVGRCNVCIARQKPGTVQNSTVGKTGRGKWLEVHVAAQRCRTAPRTGMAGCHAATARKQHNQSSVQFTYYRQQNPAVALALGTQIMQCAKLLLVVARFPPGAE